MWIYLCLANKRTVGTKYSTLYSYTSYLRGDYRLLVPHQTVQLEVKGQGIVADELIRAGQWIWMSNKMDRLLYTPFYQKLIRFVPVYLACDVIKWAYIQEMGRWSD